MLDCAGEGMEEVGDDADAEDEITAMYRTQIRSSVHEEAQRRLDSLLDPHEEARLKRASIAALVGCSTFGDDSNADANSDSVHGDLVPALMARLGDVRSALTGHGGGLVVISAELQNYSVAELAESEISSTDDAELVSLLLSLDGACISCGAAPGTLSGIRDDLLSDPEISRVAFDRALLEHYDDLAREFLEMASGVEFL